MFLKMLILKRILRSPAHTVGALFLDKQFICFTLELPDKNNAQNVSCIPCGMYELRVENHDKFGDCFRLFDVPNRSGILIHSGNYLRDTRGCILLGLTCNFSGVFPVLEHSKFAIKKLQTASNRIQKLNLNIIDL